MEAPLVSVIMPTYNRAGLIGRAVHSVIRQTFRDWELIVIDDASTDDTLTVLYELQKKDSRIVVIHNAVNQCHVSKILNHGLAVARGVYIARIDDDDYWCSSDKLARQIAFLDAHLDYVLVGTGVIVVDGAGREQYRYLKHEHDSVIRAGALTSNPFTHSTVMYRRDAARAVYGYEKPYAEDWMLWLKLGKIGKLHNLPYYMICYMLAGQNKSWHHQRAQYQAVLEIVWHFRYDYPYSLRGFIINGMGYIYTFLPMWLRSMVHQKLSFFKRTL